MHFVLNLSNFNVGHKNLMHTNGTFEGRKEKGIIIFGIIFIVIRSLLCISCIYVKPKLIPLVQ